MSTRINHREREKTPLCSAITADELAFTGQITSVIAEREDESDA